jgi:7-alpha-hydroxysteroid dehydrogenase
MILDRFSLRDKVAIVTGAGRGIGQGIAVAFAESGADVVCTSRTVSQIEATAAEVRRIGRRSLAIPCDVCKGEQVEKMVSKTMDEFGHVDILVNNAGGAPPRTLMAANQLSFESDLRTNLISVFLCTKAVVPIMQKQKSGSIVNISSRESHRPALGYGSYGAAKAGVNSITKTLAWELAPYIRVNAILPGPVLTPTTVGFPQSLIDLLIAATPMKRMGTPEDIALAAIYLASSASDWVTGQLLEVNGGVEFSYNLHQQLAAGVGGHGGISAVT